MTKTRTKILPSDAVYKVAAIIHFLRAGFESLRQAGIAAFTYEPHSEYFKNRVEHTVTMTIRFATEYPSKDAKNIMAEVMKELEE